MLFLKLICYLKHNNYIFDFTRLDVIGEAIDEFLLEKHISPAQIGDEKVTFHRSYITKWLEKHGLEQTFNLDSLWKIREECIRELALSGEQK